MIILYTNNINFEGGSLTMNENNGSTTSRTIADKHTVYAYQKTSTEIINRMSEEVKELIRMHNARTGENITTNFTLEGGSAHYSDSFAPLLIILPKMAIKNSGRKSNSNEFDITNLMHNDNGGGTKCQLISLFWQYFNGLMYTKKDIEGLYSCPNDILKRYGISKDIINRQLRQYQMKVKMVHIDKLGKVPTIMVKVSAYYKRVFCELYKKEYNVIKQLHEIDVNVNVVSVATKGNCVYNISEALPVKGKRSGGVDITKILQGGNYKK